MGMHWGSVHPGLRSAFDCRQHTGVCLWRSVLTSYHGWRCASRPSQNRKNASMPPYKRPGASVFGQDDTDYGDAKKKARMAKLAAWKANKAVEEARSKQVEDTTGEGGAPAAGNHDNNGDDDGDDVELDPLDAFMSNEILPEVKRRREEEMKKEMEERERLQAELKAGRVPKALRELLAEDTADAGAADASAADMVMQIPGKMLKRLMGPGGETIRHITTTSGCKIKVAKGEQAMNLGFGATMQDRVNAHLADSEVVTLELRGSKMRCEQAREMVLEAIDNKAERERRRAMAKEKRETVASTAAHIYRLQHAKDFEALELSARASKEDIREAYRRLAMKWHPDKNRDNKKKAEEMFSLIDRAYKNLTSSPGDV